MMTRVNTLFMVWWEELNKQLVAAGQDDAVYSVAIGYFETGHSPETAVSDILVMQELTRELDHEETA